MKNSLKLEELAFFALSIWLFSQMDLDWWWYLALIPTPDMGMLGYLINNRTGAITYNLCHHKAVALILLMIGWYLPNSWIELSGIMLLGHSSMDRIFGYGLKYFDSFKHTHLGELK